MSPRPIAERMVLMVMTPPSSGSATASASVIRPSMGFVDRFNGGGAGFCSSSASMRADSEIAQIRGMNPLSILVIVI